MVQDTISCLPEKQMHKHATPIAAIRTRGKLVMLVNKTCSPLLSVISNTQHRGP